MLWNDPYFKSMCPVCKKIFSKPGQMCVSQFLKQIYCSNACKGVALYGPNDPIEKAKWVMSKAIRTESGCLEYASALNTTGYCRISAKGSKQYLASRFIYTHLVGPIPVGLYVCHSCDNKICIEPAHLFLGTHADNMQDMAIKGRARGGNY